MHIIALIVLITLLLFTLRGCIKGFGGEIGGLAGLAAFGGLAWFGYQPFCRSIAHLPKISSTEVQFYAILAIFIVGVILFFIISKLTQKIGEAIVPQPFNALLGGLIGAAKALFFISLIAGAVQLVIARTKAFIPGEVANPVIHAMIESWKQLILPDFQDVLNSSPFSTEPTADPKKEYVNGGR